MPSTAAAMGTADFRSIFAADSTMATKDQCVNESTPLTREDARSDGAQSIDAGAFGFSDHQNSAGTQAASQLVPQPHRRLGLQVHGKISAQDYVPRARFQNVKHVGAAP